jgi:WD40 repeat protein
MAPARSAGPTEPAGKEPGRTDRYGDPLPKGAVMRLGTVRFCQPLPWSLAFSPDGKVLASGGYDNRIWLWDPDTGKALRALEGHKGPVNCIAFSADGKWLASGNQDKELRLWEVATGTVRRRFEGHTAPIERIALSPDGKVLASSCLGGTLRLWDTATGNETHSLPIDRGYRVGAMTFSPDSKRLAFNDRFEKGIQLVDVADGKVVRTFVGHKGDVYQLAFGPDGRKLFSYAADETIRAWDVATGKELRRYGDGKAHPIGLTLSPDGKTLVYRTNPDGLVHVWDLAADRDLVPPWKANRWDPRRVAFSPDGKKLVLGVGDTITIVETGTGKRLNPPPESESAAQRVEYAGDGKTLAVWRRDNTIELWDTAKWRKVATLTPKTGGGFTSMAFSPDGKRLTTAEGDSEQRGTICHWDPRTGKRLEELPQQGKGRLDSLSYSADGASFAGHQANPQRSLVLWGATTGRERGRIADDLPGSRNPRLSPDGALLACSMPFNHVGLWDVKTGKMVREFGKNTHPSLELVAFSPDGRTIATPGGEDKDPNAAVPTDIVLWELATGLERLRLPGGDDPVSQFAFSADGRLLASVGRSEAIHLWDTWSGEEVGQLTGHRGWIYCLSFAPDGKTLVSGGVDRIVLIWDVSGFVPTAKPRTEKLGREELARCWDDLAGIEAARAYRAMAELARRPDQAEGLLKDKLGAGPRVNAEQLARLIAALDSDDFDTREKASKELAGLGRLAEVALNKALDGTPSAEAKRRIQDLLGKLDRKADDPEERLLLRVIEVLERLATPEAQRLLDKLAKEATGAGAAREAKASMERLGKARRADP